MKNFKPTGLLYSGKTIKDPEKYYGSGVYWTRHLDTHGYNVTTIWKKLFTCKEELTKYALGYSLKYSIVESKDYANLKPKDGLMGGDTGISDEGREIIRAASKARTHSEESKRKLSEANKGRELGTKKGTKFSDEHRAKMSVAAKARHARRKLS